MGGAAPRCLANAVPSRRLSWWRWPAFSGSLPAVAKTPPRTPGPRARVATRGSDTHPYNQAEQVAERSAIRAEQAERKAKLDGQAKTYGTSDDNLPNPIEAGNRAALSAEAERYVEQLVANAESTQDSSSQEFVPGTRHMPVR